MKKNTSLPAASYTRDPTTGPTKMYKIEGTMQTHIHYYINMTSLWGGQHDGLPLVSIVIRGHMDVVFVLLYRTTSPRHTGIPYLFYYPKQHPAPPLPPDPAAHPHATNVYDKLKFTMIT